MATFQRIFVTGASGMLGQDLVPYLEAKGYQVTGVSSQQLNLLSPSEEIFQVVEKARPDIIIHGAAYTQVDKAESEPEVAFGVNQDGTAKLAQAAQKLGIPLAMVSTDYVFDGTQQTPYHPTDPTHPLGIYGQSKLAGEKALQEVLPEHFIIRTSWLYGVAGKNFVRFVLDKARQQDPISVITDQWGSPTWTGSLSRLIEVIITNRPYGIYHASDSGMVSRYDQAKRMLELTGFSTELLKPVTSEVFSLPAPRPAYSVMDCGDLPVALWEEAFMQYWAQLKETVPEFKAALTPSAII